MGLPTERLVPAMAYNVSRYCDSADMCVDKGDDDTDHEHGDFECEPSFVSDICAVTGIWVHTCLYVCEHVFGLLGTSSVCDASWDAQKHIQMPCKAFRTDHTCILSARSEENTGL